MTNEESIEKLKSIKSLVVKYDDVLALRMAIKALEQEFIIDKIRAEIEKLEYLNIEDGSGGYDEYIEQYEVLKIIDKYKVESEE